MVNLQTRVVSGKGVLKLDTESQDYKSAKIITLYVDVIRYPQNEYLNFNWNPPKGRYATLVFIKEDYVVHTEALEYPRQSFTFHPEIGFQNTYAIQCAYSGILQTFVNLGIALALPPISIANEIADWRHTDLWWDTVKIVCYSDTALQLSAESIPYDLCDEQDNPTPTPPPPPPSIPNEIPPGTPLEETDSPISPPYDGNDDGGDFEPYPGDYTPPPPPPEGTPIWQITTSERTFLVVSPDEPGVFSNYRCTTVRGLQAVGSIGQEGTEQYCGEFSNYCLNEGETVTSIVATGDYCEEDFP